MTSLTHTYPLKLPQDATLRLELDMLQDIVMHAAQKLLAELWSDHWIDTLDSARTKKTYKVINERRVNLTTSQGTAVYLPSRIRRCIAEQVGRILRSQAIRKQCYYDVLRIVQLTGVEGKLDNLVRTVALTLANFEGIFYRWALIRQTLRMFRRYYYQLGLDLSLLLRFPYSAVVKPRLHSFSLPYSPDEGQALQYDWQPHQADPSIIAIRLKPPCRPQPTKRSHWGWQEFTLSIPAKLQARVISPSSKLCPPNLRYITLKGGLTLPFLECAWSFDPNPQHQTQPQTHYPPLRANRVLATDLGVINLTTSVICEAGSQLSPPIFWSPSTTVLQKIDALYHHISRLQRKLDRYPVNWYGQGKRREELERLYRKLNRYREEILHLASNQLLETALTWGCKTIVLEDLRNYQPPKHLRKISRKLSNWLRGAFYEILKYKAQRYGIKLVRVNPRWTSSFCPRCGAKGAKISDPRAHQVLKRGRFFYCGACSYLADRDYIAAVNIYRVYQEKRKKRFSLKQAKPVPYMATGIPLNRPSGDSIHRLVQTLGG
ncbi:transposase [Candidatus Borrarchaeum sp.]|uniref:RNA-guided endonuclease InsQ/TnpB family protein n=1 Tax=Candidatus Borrarchaeum sp. TaxID=2846742 RepID=UPI00257C09A9|nr:transposase [Candidatus Borrarchaeum sp.]